MRLHPGHALLALLCACAASGPKIGSGERPAGPEIEVRLLGSGRLIVGGREMNLESLDYELRVLCREAASDPSRVPWLRVVAAPDDTGAIAAFVGRLRTAASDAGVLYIELEQG